MQLLVFQCFFFVFTIQWDYRQTSKLLSELAWNLERVIFPKQKTFHVEDATRTQHMSWFAKTGTTVCLWFEGFWTTKEGSISRSKTSTISNLWLSNASIDKRTCIVTTEVALSGQQYCDRPLAWAHSDGTRVVFSVCGQRYCVVSSPVGCQSFDVKTVLLIVSFCGNIFFASYFRLLVLSLSSSGCVTTCHFLIGYLIYAINPVYDQVVLSERRVRKARLNESL